MYLNKNRLDNLIKNLKELYDVTHKDSIGDLLESLSYAKWMDEHITFRLNDLETKKAHEFCQKHKECSKHAGAVGGNITYEITPTGIGDIIKIKCLCGDSEDITDISSW